MQIDDNVRNAFNAQTTREVQAAYNYLAMAGWFESNGYPGFARWMQLQSEEEWEHAKRMFQFVLDRGGVTALGELSAPRASFGSVLEVFQAGLDQERAVSGHIKDLYGLAVDARDFASVPLLDWFISEQIEEEASFGQIVDDVQRAGDDAQAMLILDRELGSRGGSAEA